jgi:hypothetical protein
VAEDGEQKSFWTTLPGILSAGAGLLAAVAALLGALASIGVFGGSDEPNTATTPTVASLDRIRLRWRAEVHPEFTRFTTADVRGVPAGSGLTLTCEGGGCFAETREKQLVDAEPVVSLAESLPRLRPGARLEIRFLNPRVGTKIWTYTMVNGDLPTTDISCVAVNETAPEPC